MKAKARKRIYREMRELEATPQVKEQVFFVPAQRKITLSGEVDFHLIPTPMADAVMKFEDRAEAAAFAEMAETVSGSRIDVLSLSERDVNLAERELAVLMSQINSSMRRMEEEALSLREIGVEVEMPEITSQTMGKAFRLGKAGMVLPEEEYMI